MIVRCESPGCRSRYNFDISPVLTGDNENYITYRVCGNHIAWAVRALGMMAKVTSIEFKNSNRETVDLDSIPPQRGYEPNYRCTS